MKKKILIVAGGEWQVPLVKKAKEMGLYTLNSNLYKDSPAFMFADKTCVSDVLDIKTNYEFAKLEEIDAILTDESDIAVPTVAYIAESLGLPGITYEKAILFTNKYEMRKFCSLNGIPSPEFRLCKNIEDVEDFLRCREEIIIKPLDSQSSRGVHLVRNRDELKKYFVDSQLNSKNKTDVLAEQRIGGREFTADAIVINGKCTTLAISIKYQYSYNPNITQMLYFTNESQEYDLNKLRKANENLVEKMGLTQGITHAEFKFENGNYYLIEIAARGGGTRISSHIVPLMSGVDNYDILIKQALGETEFDDIVIDPKLKERKAVLEFLDINEGIVKKVSGVDKIQNMNGVIELHLDFKEGDTIRKACDDRSRSGFFIAYADNEKDLQVLRNKIKENLIIEYE